MKKLILSLIIIAVFTASQSISAQNTDSTKTAKKATINTTEKDIQVVIHQDIKYYIIDGIWHTKMKNRYVLRSAPKGAKIDFKPADGKYVTMHGKKYYKCKGIFYKEHKDSIYEVVRI